jgi:hypothetical protein
MSESSSRRVVALFYLAAALTWMLIPNSPSLAAPWMWSALASVRSPEVIVAKVAPIETTSAGLTAEQQEFVAWGEARFAAAGLPLPEVHYVFHDDFEECGWHGGKYHPGNRVVTLCTTDPKTLIHELAHAWETTMLSNDVRAGFMTLRGLSVWYDHSVPWAERAAEQVAEVITWGVEEGSRLVRWTEDDGTTTFRLLTIPDASVEELWVAYELLTGGEPVLRNPEEWAITEWNDYSPEAARFSR